MALQRGTAEQTGCHPVLQFKDPDDVIDTARRAFPAQDDGFLQKLGEIFRQLRFFLMIGNLGFQPVKPFRKIGIKVSADSTVGNIFPVTDIFF